MNVTTTERTYTAAELRTLASTYCNRVKPTYSDLQYRLYLSGFLAWITKHEKENNDEDQR